VLIGVVPNRLLAADEFCNWLKGMSILGASFILRATMVSII
jgi:hypothetical protein